MHSKQEHTIEFKSAPNAWRGEVMKVNCTVRRVDLDDERFLALRRGKVSKISILNTETNESFTRDFLYYHEFWSTTLGFQEVCLLAKIGWKN